jgi:segregation and condensation protein B
MASPEEEVVEVQAEVVAEAAAEQPEVADFPGSLDLPEQIREEVSAEDLLPDEATDDEKVDQMSLGDAELKAVLEAIIYVTDEPLSLEQICAALLQPQDRVMGLLDQLAEDYERADRGLSIKEIAGGYKMATKPEHHEAVRRFVKNLNPPLKLSLPALETLAVIAYKQPITAPEIMEIRGVQGAGVLKTLVERRLIATAGRKAVIGKPILYKTTREFLVQFGLRDLAELPTLKEFQELARFDTEPAAVEPEPTPAPVATEDPAETPAPAVQDPPVEFET